MAANAATLRLQKEFKLILKARGGAARAVSAPVAASARLDASR
jgi:hypothetical protein